MGVSDQNGGATYSVLIDIPPGRNGMAPSLILRYSSNLPLRGGIAAGWNFEQPSIEVDSTLGAAEGLQYKISLGSVSGRLTEVPDAFHIHRVPPTEFSLIILTHASFW
ncbi:SpvB/TcaC N-terminal domain-containing protein [Rhodohalobacter sp.]|uniref:SpvB/TcaC N-terminal domain-containing protein n=1 Tax=Rhodohalobacter sp. TaxID=1974210 RepID=UPI002ACEFA62|nr:SpvB/TcaC N-terminal domain-containing protein [Rhodohalobacter sp.]MDZ7757531.1 SpvB/TcaC N-terminal domain-containing protein [Rhodohalobacter sp.]